jgi:hypothetical protein
MCKRQEEHETSHEQLGPSDRVEVCIRSMDADVQNIRTDH